MNTYVNLLQVTHIVDGEERYIIWLASGKVIHLDKTVSAQELVKYFISMMTTRCVWQRRK